MDPSQLPQTNLQCFDNTKISAYKTCPRMYFLRHVMFWRGSGIATPLAFGGSWHSAMDIVWKNARHLPIPDLVEGAMLAFQEKWEEEGLPYQLDQIQTDAMQPRTPMIAKEMLYNYIGARQDLLLHSEIVAIEQPFAVPLPNLTSAWYVGRLDKVISHNGLLRVIEHKTTAIYRKAGGFDSMYIEGWYSDAQIKGYQYGAGLYYPEQSVPVWIDCSLVHKTVQDAFRFVPVQHSFDIIREFLNDAEEWVGRITRDQERWNQHKELTPGNFPKNENSCYNKYGSCAFLDICRTTSHVSATDEPPFGYMVEEWSPFATLGIEKIVKGEQSERP